MERLVALASTSTTKGAGKRHMVAPPAWLMERAVAEIFEVLKYKFVRAGKIHPGTCHFGFGSSLTGASRCTDRRSLRLAPPLGSSFVDKRTAPFAWLLPCQSCAGRSNFVVRVSSSAFLPLVFPQFSCPHLFPIELSKQRFVQRSMRCQVSAPRPSPGPMVGSLLGR